MTNEEQIAHWKERALRAERAIDGLYNMARNCAAPKGSGYVMIEGFGGAGAKIQAIKAIRKCTGNGLRECAEIANNLPQILVDRHGRLADELKRLQSLGHVVEWRHV